MNDPTQAQIDAQLGELHALIEQIVAERAALAPLEQELATAWREYEDRVRPLRLEARRLQHEIDVKRACVEVQPSVPDVDARVEADLEAAQAPQSPPAAVDAEAVDKDVLLEHLVRVLDPELDASASDIIAAVQGRLDDQSLGLGDLLEQMPWGPAWTGRARNEDLATQSRRLAVWEAALRRQLASLAQARGRLQAHDPRYRLYEQRQQGAENWNNYLEREVGRLEAQNRELRAEFEELSSALVGYEDGG